MSTVAKPTDKLSAEEKRALLAQLLQQKAGAPKSFPLSFAQQRLWILDQLEPDDYRYNMPTALRLVGQLDIAALERTVNEIVRRHEVLRTTFPTLNGQPVQLIAPPHPLRLPIHDLAGMPDAERQAETQRRVNEEAKLPFDLARGPLLRVQLLRLAATEHVLLVTMHHIISDGWSIGIFVREMGLLYEAFVSGKPSPLADLPIQYVDFAAWQRQHLQGAVLDAHLDYWKRHLGGNLPVLALPTDRPRPPVRTFQGDVYTFLLPRTLSEELKSFSQQAGATMFMIILAALDTLLCRYSGQNDIVTGTVIAGRNRAEIEGLIGCFLNTLALRANLSGDPSYRELLAQVREATLGAYAHQDLPFEMLLEVLQPERNLGHNPIFQAMLILQNTPMGALELPGLTIGLLDIDKRHSEFDFTLFATDSGQGLLGSLEYCTDLFDLTTIIRLSRHLQALLAGIVAQPDRRLHDLPLLSPAERRQILVEWNDATPGVRSQESGVRSRDEACLAPTWLPASEPACVHELLAAQAARTPDAVACLMNDNLTKDERRMTNDEGSDSSFVFRPSSAVHLTYSELDRRANQLAHHLRGLGVGPEARVGICIARSPELLIALLGVLKAGGAYLPLDAAYPAERLAFMLDDSRARVLITTNDRRPTTNDQIDHLVTLSPCQLVHLDTDWPMIAGEPVEPPRSGVTADNLAYVIYTSGSTGTPKGVMVQHRSLASYTRVGGADYAIGPGDRVLQFASISWDTSAEEIYPTLAHGATLVLRSEAMIDSIEVFLRACRAHGISILNLPTAFWHELTIRMRVDALPAPDALRLLIIGGERALGERLQMWQAQVGARVRLVNTYGATETTAVATLGDLSARRAVPLREVPIGRAIGNVRVYVLDRRMQPAPIGVLGELHIGGAGVARGYLDRPDLTAARFVPNPFTNCRLQIADCRLADSSICNLQSAICNRLYRTGDLARFLPNGAVEYLGRIDQQIKLRGFRIELGEIEAVLNRHPAVWESVAVVREDASPGGERAERRLVAYVVPVQGRGERGQGTVRASRQPALGSIRSEQDSGKARSEPSSIVDHRSSSNDASEPSSFVVRPSSLVTELRAFLKEHLPDYMLPAAFVMLSELPLNPNGKVDRRALPAPDMSRSAQGRSFVAPRTRVEQALAQIWSDVLGLAYVGIHDHFFELGGHSLLATQVVARVRKDLQVELPLRSMFEWPTVAELAQVIGQRKELDSAHVRIARQPRDRDSYPLSFAQQRLWFLDQLAPGNPFYNLFSAWRLAGELSVPALARAINELTRRHESLRTRFVTTGGRPAQQITPVLAIPLPTIDLGALPEPQREPSARWLGHEEARRPFDLSRGPLLRLTLLRLAEHEHVLLLTIHHIISDGWSTALIVQELGALYEAFAEGQPSPLPSLPIQYVDFAIWQREWLAGSVLDAQLDYWRQSLAGLPTLDLPSDRPRPPVQTFRGGRYLFRLPARLTEALRALCLRERVTSFMALLAVFDVLLAHYSGQENIVVGTPIANRHHSDIERLIGFFVNTLVLRSDLSGSPTVRDLLGRIRQATLGAYAHQDLPFERLVEELQPERDISRTPLFQVLFVLNNIPVEAQQINSLGLTIRSFDVDSETTNFDLTFNLSEAQQKLFGWLSYNSDLFDAATIARLVRHYQTLLEAMLADSARCVWDLPLLTAAERQQLLAEWNDTAVEFRSQESGVRIPDTVSDLLASNSWLLASDDACLHELIAAQAARTPDAIACVTMNDEERTMKGENGSFIVHPSSFILQLSYAGLDRRANQLAHYLRTLGVGPDAPVGVCMERSLELVIALLGVLKAGGAYLPLEPTYPGERISFMLEDSGAAVVLTATSELFDKVTRRQGDKETDLVSDVTLSPPHLVTGSHRTVVELHTDWPAIAQQPKTRPGSGASAESLAYVIYTSGSTGRPKGTLNSHRGIVNRLLWMQRTYALNAADRVLQKTPFSFDVSVWEFFWPLLSGAALMLARPGGHQDPRYLAGLIARSRITTLHFVPSMLQVFLETPGLAACRGIRRVICSGEALAYELASRFFARLDAELHNLYGPTEAAVDVTAWCCRPGDDGRPVPIGRPIANTQIYLLDRRLRPAPIGIPGELYIGGVQLARGYLNRPDLTATAFVPNPFARVSGVEYRVPEDVAPNTRHPIPDTRLYKTGDLARYRPDGSIEFLGRRDQQVKLRGFRIELGEIASELARHEAVREAVVLARADVSPGDTRLIAYVVPTEGTGHRAQGTGVRSQETEVRNQSTTGDDTSPRPSSIVHRPPSTDEEGSDSSFVLRPSSLGSELRAFLAERLPDYMVPSAFVLLEALPTTPNGKLDRAALPLPDQARAEPEETYVAPRTPVEEEVASIWAELLGVERVGIQDNFFALGGHSLLMTQVVSRVWATFDVEVPIQSFFQDPTVAGLALKITEMRVAQHDTDTISQLLDQIDQLSAEDLQALIEQPAAPAAGPVAAEIRAAPLAAPVERPPGERYRYAAFERIPVGDQQVLLYSRQSHAAEIMPAADGDLLERCRDFKTLDEHARELAGDLAGDEAIAAVRQRLDRLAGTGLLLAEQAFLDRIAPPDVPPAVHIATVGFPTSDRVPALQRALISYIEQRRRYERAHEFVVMDDARRPESRRACREMLGALKSRYGVAIHYAGMEEKTDFARKLIDAGDLPPDIVNFALFGEQLGLVTLGANRNGLLLDTVGEVILSADDDTICRMTPAPERDDRLAVAAGRAPVETWVYRDRAAQQGAAPFTEADALAQHEQLLGQDPRDCIAAFRARAGVDLAHADAHLLQRLESSAGRVAVTLNGIRGDCGWGSPSAYLFMSGASFERLTRSEAAYRAACTSREILHVAPRPTLTDRADDLMTTFFGLDNRALVPPFLTVGRGSDGIFGTMLSRCFDDRYFAYLPWALLHTPAEARAFWPGEITRSGSGISIALLVTILIHSFQPGPGSADGAERLRALGRHINQLARLPEAEFEEFLRLQIWRGASMQIAALEERLSAQEAAPAYWTSDVRTYLNLLRQSLSNRELTLPLELLPGRSLSEARAQRQRLALAFGQLFSWWPAISETASGLRAQGERLSRPI